MAVISLRCVTIWGAYTGIRGGHVQSCQVFPNLAVTACKHTSPKILVTTRAVLLSSLDTISAFN